MNQLDSSAIPMDIFQETPDLTPYKAILPVIAPDNLITHKSEGQGCRRVDEKIGPAKFRACGHGRSKSVERGDLVCMHWKRIKPSAIGRLPAYEAMRLGIANLDDDERGQKRR